MSGCKIVFFNVLVLVLSFVYAEISNEIEMNEAKLEYLNESVDPCTDFYEYSCGNFKNVHPLPENEPVIDHFKILQDELFRVAKTILLSAEEDVETVSLKKARAAYAACLNTPYADKLDMPEIALLSELEGWPIISESACPKKFSWNNVGSIVAKYAIPLFFTFNVMPNLFNANENVIAVDIAAISPEHIVDSPENFIRPQFMDYSDDILGESGSRKLVHPYETFLKDLVLLLQTKTGVHKSEDQIKEEIKGILDFIKRIKDVEKNPGFTEYLGVEALQNLTHLMMPSGVNINWLQFLNKVFSKSGVKITNTTQVMLVKNQAIFDLLNLVQASNDDDLQNFIVARLFTETAEDSNTQIRSAHIRYRMDMGDTIYERSEYCIRQILGYPRSIGLSMAITNEYQKYHFDISKFKILKDMIDILYSGFTNLVRNSTWMDEESKNKTYDKIEKMITVMSYPDFIEHPKMLDEFHENLRICSWDHFGNAQRLRAFQQAYNFALLGKPRNREVWPISPLYVNAFYNHANNRILIPISMMNDPFFGIKVTALDFGRLGTIISHEITHGFDKQGTNYDGNGSFVGGWWSSETSGEYKKIADCFEDQYSKYFISEINEYVNSKNSISENIADNGGLRQAFLAFQDARSRGMEYDSLRGYTPEQSFFIGYGTQWCSVETEKYLKENQQSKYPPSRFRVIGSVSNNEDFAKAFNCSVGSPMNPEKKCVLW